MVVPRSKLIRDLVTPGLPITLHIPEASINSLNLLVQLLYGLPVEVSEDVLPQLRSICKALGLGGWLEETLLTEKDISAAKIKEPKEESIRRESESLPDPLDMSVISVARRSPRVQTLQCELCDSTCFSLASLQCHYDKCHFAPASDKKVRGGRVAKTTPSKTSGESKDCSLTRVLSRNMSAAKPILSDFVTDQECRVNLKDLKRQEGVLAELLGKGMELELKKDELMMHSSLKKGGNLDEDCNEVETRGRGSTTPRLRSRQSKDGSVGEGVNEAEKEEYFFLLWNKFLANKVIDFFSNT